mmetsp:Transcript_4948/g.11295  ORF Transcript_4948/g.11295 Transcript_4948/m.11295 type:complete len:158 (-) Transcript_4948:648-1121(-)
MYTADHTGSIDPQDSFNGYEAKPNSSDFNTDGPSDEAFHPDYYNDAEQQHANHLHITENDTNETSHNATDTSEMKVMMSVAKELSQAPNYTPFVSSQPNLFMEENETEDSRYNIDELLEETMTDLEQTSNTDIYSILDKLEKEAGGNKDSFRDEELV